MSARTRRLKIHYSVESYYGPKCLWWCKQLNKWIDLEEPEANGLAKSSSRTFRTKKRAFAHARKMGKGFVVVRMNPKIGWRRKLGNGTWQVTTWVI